MSNVDPIHIKGRRENQYDAIESGQEALGTLLALY